MSKFGRSLFLLLAITLIYSCKSTRKVSKSTTQSPQADTLEIDSLPETVIEKIEITEDTLAVVDSIVSIPKQDTFSIIGVGDIMMGTNFPKR